MTVESEPRSIAQLVQQHKRQSYQRQNHDASWGYERHQGGGEICKSLHHFLAKRQGFYEQSYIR